jgi:hypothetical protein
MRCLICEATSGAPPCTYHPGRCEYVFTTGAQTDYADIYFWSCCAKTERTSVTPSGTDIPPSRSPGCAIVDKHLYEATVAICYSSEFSETVELATKQLRSLGYTVRTMLLATSEPPEFMDCACVTFVPALGERARAERLADVVQGLPKAPWVNICNSGTDSAYSRIQTCGADDVANATTHGVLLYHAGPSRTQPFRIFLSYRTADVAVAKTMHQLMSCWWDKKVLCAGVDWATDIELAIKDCGLFLMLVRGELPSNSYVWREFELARTHNRTIAILAFGDEGRNVLNHAV